MHQTNYIEMTDIICPVCDSILRDSNGRNLENTTAELHTICTNSESTDYAHYACNKTSTGWVDMTVVGPFEIIRNFRVDANVASIFKTRTVITKSAWELDSMDYCISDSELYELCQKYKRLLCLT